jgi:ABC-type dipeptide/oligopeptide/nickel transport system permease subunit
MYFAVAGVLIGLPPATSAGASTHISRMTDAMLACPFLI